MGVAATAVCPAPPADECRTHWSPILYPVVPIVIRAISSLIAAAFGLFQPAPVGGPSLPTPPSVEVVLADMPAFEAPAVDVNAITDVAQAAQVTLLALDHGDGSVGPARRRLAELVGQTSTTDAAALESVWSSASGERQRAVFTGLAQVGIQYRRNGSSPSEGFDCSGLTSYAWARSGLTLTHNSEAQIRAASSRVTAAPGDIVHYPGHIMLALGVDTLMVHAFATGKPVAIQTWGTRRVRIGDPLSD